MTDTTDPPATGEPDHVVGVLLDGRVLCLGCASPGDADSPPPGVCRLWRSNIWPYRQSCHRCGVTMVTGKSPSWPELYEKPS